MSDFERRLADALKAETSGYRPHDPYEAKQRFMHRYRRRRLMIGAGVALATGTAAVAAFFLVPGLIERERAQVAPPATDPSTETVHISVGTAPNGIAFGARRVWVVNSEDGTVSSITPATNQVRETYDIGGSPDDLAVGFGALWVADSERGVVTKVRLADPAEREEISVQPGGEIDISVGTGAAWVVSGGVLHRVDPLSGTVSTIPGISDATDVAAGHGAVAVVGASFIGRVEPGAPTVSVLSEVGATVNQDLHLSPGAAWFGDGDAGTVTRVDLASGEAASPVDVGGNYIAIAQGSGSVWAISGDTTDEGSLLRIDPSNGAIVGEPLTLDGRPYDIATGAGAVWVLNRAAETVTRIDPGE